MATGKILGRSTASDGIVEEISIDSVFTLAAGTFGVDGTNLTAALDVFTPTLKGLVPSGGSAGDFLRGDGTWYDVISYVDNAVQGLDIKASVVTATSSNITLSAEQDVNGVVTSASRVLVKNQTTAAENGIYISGSGSWTRAEDFDDWQEIPGAFVFVESGNLASTGWVCSSPSGGTIGSTNVTFTQFSGAGTYTAGSGVALTGNYIGLAAIANNRVMGNVSGSSAVPQPLNTSSLTTLVDTFTTSLKGAVPASGGGTTNFLRADGNFADPLVAADILTKIKTVDGTGSGLDADTLDGVEGATYARLDGAQTFTSMQTVASGTSEKIRLVGDNSFQTFYDTAGTTRAAFIQFNHTNNDFRLKADATNADIALITSGGGLTFNGVTVWHAGNDGAGSTLDADLLDGQHGSYYQSRTNHTGTQGISSITMNTAKMLGRTTASSGAVEEITVGTGLTLNAGTLYSNATSPGFTPVSATGTGVSQNIELPVSGLLPEDVFVFVNGTRWESDEYTISGTTLTLTTNSNGDSIEILKPAGATGPSSTTLPRNYSFNGASVGTETPDGVSFAYGADGNLSNSTYGTIFNVKPTSNRTWQLSVGDGGNEIYFRNQSGGGTAWEPVVKLWHTGNDGSGSGLDADTLDGLQADSFAQCDTLLPTNADKYLYVSRNNAAAVLYVHQRSSGDIARFYQHSSTAQTSGTSQVTITNGGGITATGNVNANNVLVSGNAVWHSGNDGSGSGLDADTVDGLQASSLVQTNGNQIINDTKTFAGAVILNGSFGTAAISDLNTPAPTQGRITHINTSFQSTNRPGVANYHSGLHFQHNMGTDYATQLVTGAEAASLYIRSKTNGTYGGWNTVWHSGNDGSGSGLDADTLDGFQATEFARLSTTSQSLGYLYLARSDSSSPTLYVRQGGTADLARFYQNATGAATSGTSQVTLTNTGGITTTDKITVNGNEVLHKGSLAAFNRSQSQSGGASDNGYHAKVATVVIQSGKAFHDTTLTLLFTMSNGSHGQGIVSFRCRVNSEDDNLSGDVYVNSVTGDSLATNSFFIAGFSTNTFEIWVKKTSPYLRLSVTELARSATDYNTVTVTYHDNEAWQQAAPNGSLLNVQSNKVSIQTGTVWYSGNDGSGSGLDADFLDGLDSVSFARLANDNTYVGLQRFQNSSNGEKIRLGGDGGFLSFFNDANSTRNGYIQAYTAQSEIRIASEYTNGGINLRPTGSGTVNVNGSTIWHAGNDGSGSGLDADTVDGYHHGSFVKIADTYLGSVGNVPIDSVTNTVEEWSNLPVGYSRMMSSAIGTAGGMPSTTISYFTKIANRDTNGGWVGLAIEYGSGSSQSFYVGQAQTGSVFPTWDKVWTSNTDGSGSGLDADTVDGLQASSLVQTSGNQSIAGLKTITNGESLRLQADGSYISFYPTGGGTRRGYIQHDGSGILLTNEFSGGSLRLSATNALSLNNNTVWHAGNDGAGSGLDADLFDGNQSTNFGRLVGGFGGGGGAGTNNYWAKVADINLQNNYAAAVLCLRLILSNSGGRGVIDFTARLSHSTGTSYSNQIEINAISGGTFAANALKVVESSTLGIFELWVQKSIEYGQSVTIWELSSNFSASASATYTQAFTWQATEPTSAGATAVRSTDLQFNGYTVWHAGNDGAGSGLDADLLDGQQGSYYINTGGGQTISNALTTTGNLIARSGDIYLGSDGIYLEAGKHCYTWNDGGGNVNFRTAHVYNNNQACLENGYLTHWKHTQSNGNWEFLTSTASLTTGQTPTWRTQFTIGPSTVQLNYEGSNKLTTSSAGINVTGNVGGSTSLSTSSGDGNGLRFWSTDGANTSYGLWMSTAANGTYGGRVTGETTSDYNMYFKMTGGTNRGFVFINGGTNVAGIDGGGNFRCTGSITASGNITAYSDESLKKNVRTITNALEKVTQMRGVHFKSKRDGTPNSGVIAQELEKVAPELVQEQGNGLKTVAYGNSVGYLIEAIKELKEEVDILKEEKAQRERKRWWQFWR